MTEWMLAAKDVATSSSAWPTVFAGAVGGVVGVAGSLAAGALDWRRRNSETRSQRVHDRDTRIEADMRDALRELREASVHATVAAHAYAMATVEGDAAPSKVRSTWTTAYVTVVNAQERLRSLVEQDETRDAIDALIDELRLVNDDAHEPGDDIVTVMDSHSENVRRLTRAVSDMVTQELKQRTAR